MDDQTGNESSPYADTIYQQPWWLDAVAPGRWGEATVVRDGQTIARMPYFIKRKLGLTALTMPPLTQTLGPWIQRSDGKYANRLAVEQGLMEELISQLPTFDLFVQNFSTETTDWLPFYWAGFQQTTLYTYRLEDLTNVDAIWDGMLHSVRQNIRKAEKLVTVRTDLGIEPLLELIAQVFVRQDMKSPYSPDLVRRLIAACALNNCGQTFFAEDTRGRIHAALYIVWDDKTAYCVLSGADTTLRNSHAGSLLSWTAIQFAAKVTKAFDFTGSMIKSLEKHKRSYGGKMKSRMAVLSAARDAWNVIRQK
jgi:hypothetical protein